MSAHVFLAPCGTLDGYDAGSTYLLDGAEGRHAAVVQRRGVGERVDVVDGAGVRLQGQVTVVQGAALELRVLARFAEPAPAVALVLVQALAKGQRDELAVEACTELGVDQVVPWQAERCVVVWRGDRADKGRSRWQACARTAAKQSRRAHVPEVAPPVSGRGLVERVRDVVARGGVVLVLHQDAQQPLTADGAVADLAGSQVERDRRLDGAAADRAPELLVVVGPEGGITGAELEALVGAGARPVRLGPHVLRSSTAGPTAIAVLSERLGRWS